MCITRNIKTFLCNSSHIPLIVWERRKQYNTLLINYGIKHLPRFKSCNCFSDCLSPPKSPTVSQWKTMWGLPGKCNPNTIRKQFQNPCQIVFFSQILTNCTSPENTSHWDKLQVSLHCFCSHRVIQPPPCDYYVIPSVVSMHEKRWKMAHKELADVCVIYQVALF